MPKDKSMCQGCVNNFYNHSRRNGCWSFRKAKVVARMRVGIWQPPPYKWHPEKCLTCFLPNHQIMIDKDDPRVVEATGDE